MEVYLREQPRYHFTSTERENTNPHHTVTHPPNPTRGRPQSQATTTPTQPAHQKSTHNGCRTSPPKAKIARGTPSRKSTTRHLQQACPKGVGLTCQRHPITPTIPKNVPQKTHRNDQKHHIACTLSRPALHKSQPPNCHNQPQKKPQQTGK